jgi:hypothetical protein
MVGVAGGILLAFAVIAAIIIILHFWLETLLKALGWTIIAAFDDSDGSRPWIPI